MEAKDRLRRQTNDVGPAGEQVAANLRRLRDQAGISTTQLSKLLGELGRPIQPTGITKIEKGERRVDADDLVVLAVALEVNPSALLLPPTIQGEIEVTGAGMTPARNAWAWMDGKRPLKMPDDDDGEAFVTFQTYARPRGLRLYQDGPGVYSGGTMFGPDADLGPGRKD